MNLWIQSSYLTGIVTVKGGNMNENAVKSSHSPCTEK